MVALTPGNSNLGPVDLSSPSAPKVGILDSTGSALNSSVAAFAQGVISEASKSYMSEATLASLCAAYGVSSGPVVVRGPTAEEKMWIAAYEGEGRSGSSATGFSAPSQAKPLKSILKKGPKIEGGGALRVAFSSDCKKESCGKEWRSQCQASRALKKTHRFATLSTVDVSEEEIGKALKSELSHALWSTYYTIRYSDSDGQNRFALDMHSVGSIVAVFTNVLDEALEKVLLDGKIESGKSHIVTALGDQIIKCFMPDEEFSDQKSLNGFNLKHSPTVYRLCSPLLNDILNSPPFVQVLEVFFRKNLEEGLAG